MREEALFGREVAAEADRAGHGGEDPGAVAAVLGIGVVPQEEQAEGRPDPPQRGQGHDQGGGQQQGDAEAGRLGELEQRPGHQHEHGEGVDREDHHVRRAAPQGGAQVAGLRIEADRVAYRAHGQGVGEQQRYQREGRGREPGARDGDEGGQEPGQRLDERRSTTFGIGHAQEYTKRVQAAR